MNDPVQSVANLVGVLAWPVVVVGLVMILRKPLAELIDNIKSVSVKAGGNEVSIETEKKVETALAAAVGSKSSSDSDTAGAMADARSAASRAINLVPPNSSASAKLGLWVDDKPENNRYEQLALEALGLRFRVCTTTDEALALLKEERYSVIISDMARPPDNTAGLRLLDNLPDTNRGTPFIIYAGTATPQQIASTKQHGGLGQTSDPAELVELVAEALHLQNPPQAG